MAWVQLNEGEGKYLLRKPLGKTPAEKPLSCWAWYVGFPTERVEFGAHDCGRSDELSQETVSGNHGNSRVADGNLQAAPSQQIHAKPFSELMKRDWAKGTVLPSSKATAQYS